MESELSPYHFIDHTGIALDDLDHLGGHIFLCVIRNRNPIVPIPVHGHCRIHRLQEAVFINSGKDEAGFVQCFRTFRLTVPDLFGVVERSIAILRNL